MGCDEEIRLLIGAWINNRWRDRELQDRVKHFFPRLCGNYQNEELAGFSVTTTAGDVISCNDSIQAKLSVRIGDNWRRSELENEAWKLLPLLCDEPVPVEQCSDGIDNDGDGEIDLADDGCDGPTDDDETDPPPPPPPNWTGRPATVCTPYTDNLSGLTAQRMTTGGSGGVVTSKTRYSRIEPENADGTLFMTYQRTAGAYAVWRVDDCSLVRQFNSNSEIDTDGEPQWHPSDPDKIRMLAGTTSSSGDLKLYQISVSGGGPTQIADLTARARAVWSNADHLSDGAEGSPSAKGCRYAWGVRNSSERWLGIVSYDLCTDTVLGTKGTGNDLDHVSISPSGNYVVESRDSGTRAYPANLGSTGTLLLSGSEHSDLGRNAAGNDVFCYIDFIDDGDLECRDLVTGAVKALFNVYQLGNTSIHVSGRALNGWFVFSTYGNDAGSIANRVFAVNYDTLQWLDLAETHQRADTYWTEPHASPNRDLTRVYWNSDSGRGGDLAEVYRVDL